MNPKIADRKQDGIPGHSRKIRDITLFSRKGIVSHEFSGSCPWNSGLDQRRKNPIGNFGMNMKNLQGKPDGLSLK